MRKLPRPAAVGIVLILLWGCATVQPGVVHLCRDRTCEPLTEDRRAKERLLVEMARFLRENLNREIVVREADGPAKTWTEKDLADLGEGASFFVQGGPMPGRALIKSIKFTDVLYVDRDNLEIKVTTKERATWNLMPVFSAETEGVLQIRSAQEIRFSKTFVGSWLVAASFFNYEWLIDYIDLERGILGGHFSIRGGGLLNIGGGRGYQLLKGEGVKPPKAIAAVETPAAPELSYGVAFTESSGDGVIEGGEEIVLKVEVENRGKGEARDVQVVISGSPELISHLGDRKSLGDIGPGGKKTAVFKALLPLALKAQTADLRIEVAEGRGYGAGEAKNLRIAMRPGRQAVREVVEVVSQVPDLTYAATLKDANDNRVLESNEEITLEVAVENKGEGTAKDVRVELTGSPSLLSYFGGGRVLGDMAPGEKKTAVFKTVLPRTIPTETAQIKVNVREGRGFSPPLTKTLRVAMRALEVREAVETISEASVDDIPLKVKGFERKEAVALVMGIGTYREKAIPKVKYAARDAEVMARYLENVGGVPRANIKVLTDEKATKSDLVAHVTDWLPRRVTGDSTVFVYFAGHGTPGPKGTEAYLIPYEGHPDFPSQLYPLREMYETLNRLPAREVVVFLDSCFSGAGGRSVTGEGTRPVVISIENPVLAGGKILVLAAATGGQMSSDYDRVKHGLFTYYLLRGLRGEAARDREGKVELGDLYRFVREHVAKTAAVELNRDQTPVLLPAEETVADRLKMTVSKAR